VLTTEISTEQIVLSESEPEMDGMNLKLAMRGEHVLQSKGDLPFKHKRKYKISVMRNYIKGYFMIQDSLLNHL
jgi:hypothetical protein